MLSLLDRANLPRIGFAVIFFAFGLLNPNPLPAQERYPAVARISFVSGPVTYSRGDDPDEWDDAIENVPLTIGDAELAEALGVWEQALERVLG